ncbi:hypothetical protein [Nocardiopsis baichengensis]|uniref:hypothetical protein n=1 Tax=Nocardiopsis baichengensis TaxID=280240 RepID=UPI00034A5700|nr:hypothetical protein [Nocardiopsis baichengensis]
MTPETAVMVVVDIHVGGTAVPAEQFHERATGLMEELAALEQCNREVIETVVSSDAARSVLTVEILVDTGDVLKAAQKAFAVLRTALHAAGATTRKWPRIDRMDNHMEVVGDLSSV